MEHSLKSYTKHNRNINTLMYDIHIYTYSMILSTRNVKLKFFNNEKKISLHIYKNPQIGEKTRKIGNF